MIDKLVRILLLTVFFCKMTKILNFLTKIVVKNKKMCYNISKLRNRREPHVGMDFVSFSRLDLYESI